MASNSRTATPTHSSGMLATEDCHIAGGTGRSGPGGISAIRPTREHPRLTSRTTFVVSTRRREFRDSSLRRTHALSSAELESPRARVPHTAGCEFPPGTRLRTGAHVKYPTRYPPAYAHSRSNDGTPFSYVGDEVHRAMNRPITRTQIPGRGGRRIPAQSHSAPLAQSPPGIRITIVSRPHAPSIIAPWQGSGRRSVSGQTVRHDGDLRTA